MYKVHGALPARYRANASWLGNNLIYHLIRQFDTAGGAGLWSGSVEIVPPNCWVVRYMRPRQWTARSPLLVRSPTMRSSLRFLQLCDRGPDRADRRVHSAVVLDEQQPSDRAAWLVRALPLRSDSVSDNAFRVLNVASASYG